MSKSSSTLFATGGDDLEEESTLPDFTLTEPNEEELLVISLL